MKKIKGIIKPSKVKKATSRVTQVVVQSIEGPRILFETSFLVALLDSVDSNHQPVKSLFGFIEPYKCRFHMPLYVYAELISKFIHKGKSVAETLKILDDYISKIPGSLVMGVGPTPEEIRERYKKIARKKIRMMQSNDFYIGTEGMLSGSLILTCDHQMYSKMKAYYADIYFVATHTGKYVDDIPRFTKKFLSLAMKSDTNNRPKEV